MLLTGSFNRSLDEKLRLAIPKRLTPMPGWPEGGALFLAPGTDVSLAIYPEVAFGRLAERLAGSPTRQDVRAFARLFYAQERPTWMPKVGCGFRRSLPNWPNWKRKSCSWGSGIIWNLGCPAVASVSG